MDTTRIEGRDDERDGRKPYTRPVLRPLVAREQSHNPMLGDGHHHHQQHDDQHNEPCHDDYNYHGTHHHHGPGNNDILDHTHNGTLNHEHRVVLIDNSSVYVQHNAHYGPADHDHDDGPTNPPSDGEQPDPLRRDWHGSPVDGRLELGNGQGQ